MTTSDLICAFCDTQEYICSRIPSGEMPITTVIDEHFDVAKQEPGFQTSIRVIDSDSLTAATPGCLVLNFASGWTPGGGVVKGCRAQEEDLCRRSSLYPALVSPEARDFYDVSHRHPNIGTDIMLHHRHVRVLKDSDLRYLQEPFDVDILTVAAPRLIDGCPVSPEDLHEILRQRINAIITTCARLGYKRIVLGAWGCGAYRNDPEEVATLFREALQSYGGYFDEIIFPIPGTASPNHIIFSRVLI